jgi:hypothetical protein
MPDRIQGRELTVAPSRIIVFLYIAGALNVKINISVDNISLFSVYKQDYTFFPAVQAGMHDPEIIITIISTGVTTFIHRDGKPVAFSN